MSDCCFRKLQQTEPERRHLCEKLEMPESLRFSKWHIDHWYSDVAASENLLTWYGLCYSKTDLLRTMCLVRAMLVLVIIFWSDSSLPPCSAQTSVWSEAKLHTTVSLAPLCFVNTIPGYCWLLWETKSKTNSSKEMAGIHKGLWSEGAEMNNPFGSRGAPDFTPLSHNIWWCHPRGDDNRVWNYF